MYHRKDQQNSMSDHADSLHSHSSSYTLLMYPHEHRNPDQMAPGQDNCRIEKRVLIINQVEVNNQNEIT